MATNRYRIGLSGCAGGLEISSTRELLHFAEQAEALGFEGLWINEQHFQAEETDGRRCLSPLMLAASIAARTRRIRIGFSVLLLPLYQPIRFAEDLATLDVLTEGRVDIGISRGTPMAGLKVFAEGNTLDFQASLDLVLRAWGSEPLTLEDGTHIAVEPKPVQQPHPPVYIGTYTDSVAEAAARAGHRILCHGITSIEKAEQLLRAFIKGGGNPADVPVGRFVYVGESDAQARADLQPALRILLAKLGQVAKRRGGFIPEHLLEPELFYEHMVIAGSPATCAAKIRAMHDRLGTNYLNALTAFFGFLAPKLLMPSLTRLSREVKPLLEGA